MTFFKGRIERNVADPQIFPESRELDAQLGDGKTVLQTIAAVVAAGDRVLYGDRDGSVMFTAPDGVWVNFSFKPGCITLELGEPAA